MVRERKRFPITDYFSDISIYKLSIPTSSQNFKWTRKIFCTWKSKRRVIKRDKGIKWMEIDKLYKNILLLDIQPFQRDGQGDAQKLNVPIALNNLKIKEVYARRNSSWKIGQLITIRVEQLCPSLLLEGMIQEFVYRLMP